MQNRNAMDTTKKTENITVFWNENKRSFAVVTILLIVAYGMKVFHLAISHDTEAIISAPQNLYDSWISMGRFGLVAIKYLLGLDVFNPYLAAVFCFLAFLANAVLWEYLFWKISACRKNFSKASWMFPALFLTAPIIADQVSFLLQAFEVQIALLMTGLSLLLLYGDMLSERKHRILKKLWAVVLLLFSFSCYQSTVPLFIAGTCACFLLVLPRAEHKWKILFEAVFCFAAAFVLYELFSKIIMNFLGILPTGYISDQIQWGTNSVSVCLENIFRHILSVLKGEGVFYSISYLVALVMGIILLIAKAVKRSREFWWMLLAGGLLLLSPFLMTVLMGQAPESRVQIVLPFVFAFVFQYFFQQWEWLFENHPVFEKRLGILIGAGGLILCLQQCVWDARIYYTEYVVYQEDVRLAEKISDRIDQLNLGENPEEPVVFIGRRIPMLNKSAYPHISTSGYSFFELSFSTAHGTWVMRNFMSTLGYSYIYPSDEQMQLAESYAGYMPSWPDTGSVAEYQGVIIVKLSE